MKVMCITKKTIGDSLSPTMGVTGLPTPNEGDIVTVIGGVYDTGILFYEFQEYKNRFLDSRNFAPLSSIDETELIKERLQEA